MRDKIPLPSDDLKFADAAQEKADKDSDSLLPCDPCMDLFSSETETPEPVVDDLGVGVEEDLYEF